MGIKGCKQAIIVFGAILCFISIIPGCGSGSKPPSPVLKKVEIQPATITVQKTVPVSLPSSVRTKMIKQ